MLKLMVTLFRGFGFKVAVAAAFGIFAGIVLRLPCCVQLLAPEWSCQSFAGALFAVSVFMPYVKRDRFVWLRCIGLAVIGALGYPFAWAVGWGVYDEWHLGYRSCFCAGVLAGSAVILVGAKFLVPLGHSFRVAVAGAVAAIAGSFILSLPLYQHDWVAWGLWHAVMAIAIYGAQYWVVPFRGER